MYSDSRGWPDAGAMRRTTAAPDAPRDRYLETDVRMWCPHAPRGAGPGVRFGPRRAPLGVPVRARAPTERIKGSADRDGARNDVGEFLVRPAEFRAASHIRNGPPHPRLRQLRAQVSKLARGSVSASRLRSRARPMRLRARRECRQRRALATPLQGVASAPHESAKVLDQRRRPRARGRDEGTESSGLLIIE
jgi:hypothetical protein